MLEIERRKAMDDAEQVKTASVLNIAAGIWLALSPIWISLFGAGQFWSLYIVAGIVIVFSFIQLFSDSTLPSWLTALAAIWLFISAFALGVTTAAAWNQAITAIVAFALSVWDSVEVGHVHQRHIAGTA
jgi:membrane-associated phospholipid phosphatase